MFCFWALTMFYSSIRGHWAKKSTSLFSIWNRSRDIDTITWRNYRKVSLPYWAGPKCEVSASFLRLFLGFFVLFVDPMYFRAAALDSSTCALCSGYAWSELFIEFRLRSIFSYRNVWFMRNIAEQSFGSEYTRNLFGWDSGPQSAIEKMSCEFHFR